MELLLSLGIKKVKASFALKEFNNNVEIAADWCLTEGLNWTPQSLNSIQSGSIPIPKQDSPPPTKFTTNSIPPKHKLILPGKNVTIVLKEDQGSDKTVFGKVLQVLTKSDHPRGVKVKLIDGRVGRVVGILD